MAARPGRPSGFSLAPCPSIRRSPSATAPFPGAENRGRQHATAPPRPPGPAELVAQRFPSTQPRSFSSRKLSLDQHVCAHEAAPPERAQARSSCCCSLSITPGGLRATHGPNQGIPVGEMPGRAAVTSWCRSPPDVRSRVVASRLVTYIEKKKSASRLPTIPWPWLASPREPSAPRNSFDHRFDSVTKKHLTATP